jgi:hypothetical protein
MMPGKKLGFRCAEQQSRCIELARCADETGENCDHSPGDHDAGDPLARTPPLDNDGARNLQQQIADKKQTRAKSVDPVAESQIDAHAQIGERQVGPVDIADDVEKKYERQKMPGRSAACALADVIKDSLHRWK